MKTIIQTIQIQITARVPDSVDELELLDADSQTRYALHRMSPVVERLKVAGLSSIEGAEGVTAYRSIRTVISEPVEDAEFVEIGSAEAAV